MGNQIIQLLLLCCSCCPISQQVMYFIRRKDTILFPLPFPQTPQCKQPDGDMKFIMILFSPK